MKFIKLVAYTTVVFGTVVIWENCRGYILERVGIENVKSGENNLDEKNVSDNASGSGNISTDEQVAPATEKTVIAEEEKKLQNESSDKNVNISFEKGFEDIAKNAMHSVVNVATMQLVETGSGRLDIPDIFRGGPFDDLFKDFFNFPQRKPQMRKANALGSGFIIRVDRDVAYIVTNNHVVERAKKVVVFLSDKTELPAKIHAVDARTDIAVLSVSLNELNKTGKKIVPMEWGDSSKLHEGNFVIAIGNPFGLGSTVTSGIVSATGRNIAMGRNSMSLTDNFIQHSAAINMGNSGGALLDVHGKVVGINNAIFSTSGGNIGIGFAIPSDIARITVSQLIEHKRTFRGWLGAEVHAVGSKQAESVGLIKQSTLDSSKIYGAYVAKVVPNSPASKAGIQVGDIIIEFDGKKISENCSLQMAVGMTKIGNSVKVKVWRNQGSDVDQPWGQVEVSVTVGDFEKAIKDGALGDDENNSATQEKNKTEAKIDCLGITVSTIPEQHKSDYPEGVKVIVSKVDEEQNTSFYGSVFAAGDGFISADNKKVTSVAQLTQIMEKASKDPARRNKPVPFIIVRDGFQMMIATTLNFTESQKQKAR